ncbi:MAG TPA: VOC family protein [Vicinamibacterales bacterium]
MKPTRALVAMIVFGIAAPAMQNGVVIDHLILGIDDLDRGIADFEGMTGVRPVIGGVHPGRGTRNALVSLGEGVYLEIIAPDPKQSVESDMVRELKPLMTLTPVGWAVGTDDLFSLQAKLQAREIRHGAAMPGSRALPDGSRLQWSTTEVTLPQHNWMPFFIKWSDPAKHPSRTSPSGCSLTSAEIQDPNPDPLTHVFSAIRLKVPAKRGEASRMTIRLKCPKGRVTFQGSAS